MTKANFIRRTFAVAATAVVALALGSVSFAQYDDNERYDRQGYGEQSRQYGYQSGYRDGFAKGRHEGRENDPGDVNSRALRDATRGYQSWMGDVQRFQDGYRDGYQRGFREGYLAVNRGYETDRRYSASGNYDQFGNAAYQTGYQDGAAVAREDAQRGKRYNAQPRGRYDDLDHGYRREYGSKDQYKAEYGDGYRDGYQSAWRY